MTTTSAQAYNRLSAQVKWWRYLMTVSGYQDPISTPTGQWMLRLLYHTFKRVLVNACKHTVHISLSWRHRNVTVIDNTVIDTLIKNCWLDATAARIEPTDIRAMHPEDDRIIASVIFTGKSQGSLTLIMGEALAKTLTANAFGTTADAATYDDLRDCIGELANVLAGNLKTEIFGNSELSKPLVMQGDDSLLTALQIDSIFQQVYESHDREQLLIQICQAT